MSAKLIGSGILGFLLLSGPAAAQDVYKWIDNEGITSYGETPPTDGEVVRTNIRIRRTDPADLQARVSGRQAANDAVTTRKRNQRKAAEEDKQEAAENAAIREQNCQAARERKTKYDQAHRLFRLTADGERQYLTDAELDAERADANRQVSEWCGGR